jgi:SNF2 family DNA or RNA helicase
MKDDLLVVQGPGRSPRSTRSTGSPRPANGTKIRINPPSPLKEIGLAETNQVGIAPDALGTPMICFAGREKPLGLLTHLPGAVRWQAYDCIAYPLSKTNLLVTETVGRIDAATDEYIQIRDEMLAAPKEWVPDYPETPDGQPDPYKHQIDAFCWAVEALGPRKFHGFGQYSEQGCGKTRWAIDLMRWFGEGPVLILCQKGTSLQWKAAVEAIWPEAEVVMLIDLPLTTRAEMLALYLARKEFEAAVKPHIFILNWDVLARLVKHLCCLRWRLVIADEVTRIKERTAKVSKAAYKLADHADYRVPMTGTPMGNHPGDLWSIYRFMDARIFGSSYWNFMRQFFLLGGFSGNDFTGFNPLQIGTFIGRMYSCAYRVTKATITDMPEKSYQQIDIPLSTEQQSIYCQIEEELYASRVQEDGTVQQLSVANALVQITRLQQITSGLFPVQGEAGGRAVCEPIQSAKTEWLINYVRYALADTDQQMVVWCRFRPEIAAIRDACLNIGLMEDIDFGIIQGGVKNAHREELRVSLNDRENPLRILICQIQAAAFGLDLPAADVMIYHSLTFSYLERSQSVDRGHRMGRTRPYQVIDLVTYLPKTTKKGSRKRRRSIMRF